ncbi:MAG: hypothetical protein A3B90_00055 [Candidatus Magasanikbacteria bacterium RIFCSPHIGHO2_02_FULL_41_13]|uniref:Peptidase C39-like domain-containing protein n=1 Tax=Candidatus Magasanikbacteria bacterium RIFCSPHIGHO2_02_FULL_41_13 TaxID=1798676 RepID=A0A1F6M2U3_9BACT|nr:MAG: hypothetical protein A3B90_00055 [Candidatus Magasanikbacteria bacterium RIFCSPHIGHO2_02_FULL_41_13]
MRRYTFFNTTCGLFIVLALVGTAYFSRGYIKTWVNEKQNADIPVAISRVEIEKRLQTSTPQIQVSATSSNKTIKTLVTSTKSISSSTAPVPNVSATSSVPLPPQIEIPDSLNLDVPFVPQAPEKNWEQPWQDACEEAAVLMMDAYAQDKTVSLDVAKQNILSMVKWEENLGWGLSIELEKIQKIFTEYLTGYTSGKLKIVENPTVDQLKKFIANGQPVYVVASGKLLSNPHFQNGGPEYHTLVIRGYTKDSFITNDPGTQFGQNFKYKYNVLMNAIHDWNGGDVLNGRRVVMVIE